MPDKKIFSSPLVFYVKKFKHIEKLEQLYSEYPYTMYIVPWLYFAVLAFCFHLSILKLLYPSQILEKGDLGLQVDT